MRMTALNTRAATSGTTRSFVTFSLLTLLVSIGFFWLAQEMVFARAVGTEAFELIGLCMAASVAINAFGFHIIVRRRLTRLFSAIRKSALQGQYQPGEDGTPRDFDSLTRAFNALQAAQEQNLRRLQRTNEALSDIFTTTPTLMLTLNTDGHITHCSTFLQNTLGFHQDEIIGAPFSKFLDDRSSGTLQTQIMPLMLHTGHARDVSMRLKCKSGAMIDVLFSGAARSPEGMNATSDHRKWLFCAMNDVTMLKSAETQLRYISSTDHLTGLANRADLSRYMTDLFAERVNGQERIAILFIDLDNFKSINDHHGHAAGDKVLAITAERFADNLRTNDYIARIGGDEFAVICRNIKNEAGAVLAAKRLVGCLQPAIDLGSENTQGFVSASIGIALLGARVRTPEAALKMADAAMYQAKNIGRNACVVWKPSPTPSRKVLVSPDR